MEITILGCGVIGITTALHLAEQRHQVTIRTWKAPPETTSDKAAAFWSPYRIGEDAQTLSWIGETFRVLEDISRIPGSGVSMIRLNKYLKDPTDDSDNWWLQSIPGKQYASIAKDQLPKGYQAGWTTEVPLMETPVYLPYLLERFRQAGGRVVTGEQITDVRSYVSDHMLVVNCTGLGSRQLLGDQSLVAVRGQIAVIRAPSVDAIYVDADQPIYLVPRADGCVVGGTYERDVWEEKPDNATIATILERAPALRQGLDTETLLRSYAGLRPSRPTVRLEEDPVYPGLFHNYGHGGAGFTLSWGTARSVAQLIQIP